MKILSNMTSLRARLAERLKWAEFAPLCLFKRLNYFNLNSEKQAKKIAFYDEQIFYDGDD